MQCVGLWGCRGGSPDSDVCIVFRTFGSDLPEVVGEGKFVAWDGMAWGGMRAGALFYGSPVLGQLLIHAPMPHRCVHASCPRAPQVFEHNAFCAGEHPCYPGEVSALA